MQPKVKFYLTLGDVADANNGNSPPQAIIKLSDNCEIKCTVLTTNIAFSAPFTKSKTDFVECLKSKHLVYIYMCIVFQYIYMSIPSPNLNVGL